MTRDEVEDIAEVVVLRNNKETLAMFANVSTQISQIPGMVDTKIAAFNKEQVEKSRWGFRSFLSVTAILVSVGAVILRYAF